VVKLDETLRAWNTEAFARTLKAEIEGLEIGTLPLDEGLSHGGIVGDGGFSVTPLSTVEDADALIADIGIFFTELIGGCSCGDDPFPSNAYCRIRLRIDKATAEAELSAVPD
jgi:hypothetical protein